jgi:hypothetical protein
MEHSGFVAVIETPSPEQERGPRHWRMGWKWLAGRERTVCRVPVDAEVAVDCDR